MNHSRAVSIIFLFYLGILISSASTCASVCTSMVPYNGTTNDSSSVIQACIDKEPAGGFVRLPAGTYMINALIGLKMKDNVKVCLNEDTVLKAIPNNATQYAVVKFWGVQNVLFDGGTVEGERNQHTITDPNHPGEWGMGIDIRESSMVRISNVNVRNTWGDGIYIGRTIGVNSTNRNIVVENVVCDNNRRQGISLITGENILIENTVLENTHGTPPQFGIDMQPDNTSIEMLRNIVIRNLTTVNNSGGGIMMANPPNNYFISIANYTSIGEAYPINNFFWGDNNAKGIIIYEDKLYKHNCNSDCFTPVCNMNWVCDASEDATNCPMDCASNKIIF